MACLGRKVKRTHLFIARGASFSLFHLLLPLTDGEIDYDKDDEDAIDRTLDCRHTSTSSRREEGRILQDLLGVARQVSRFNISTRMAGRLQAEHHTF